MSPVHALKLLIEKGHIKPLKPQPLPDPLPPRHDPTQYCIFHQQHGHPTDWCYRLRHEIQDLIDNKIIAPPSKSNVTTNPLPTHNQVPPSRNINLIHTMPFTYNPNIYITPTHLPKRESIAVDLAFGILASSSTTSRARNFTSKSSPILGRATIGKDQPEAILSQVIELENLTKMVSVRQIGDRSHFLHPGLQRVVVGFNTYLDLKFTFLFSRDMRLDHKFTFLLSRETHLDLKFTFLLSRETRLDLFTFLLSREMHLDLKFTFLLSRETRWDLKFTISPLV
ncbi:hypothetical protein HYC85_029334 [Camellia sinensis]|uniref:Uncharacterized protein n=1 Tax=Camellia sinensis TaxID=4442 RepID=A0A7J7FXP6_CAMSI|nr:hypothetical protein HYC85_029334 [Camellia sinensis]